MAFKKMLAQRLFNITKTSSRALTNCRVSSPSVPSRSSQNPGRSGIAPDPGDNGIFRRFHHKRAVFPTEVSPEILSMPFRENLVEKLREIDGSKDRVRLDQMVPPAKRPEAVKVTVEDARKLLRVAQMAMVKSRLREIGKSWVSYSEFVRICGDGSSDREQGTRIANILDQSGNVIVLGNAVCLKPELVTEAIANQIPLAGVNPDPNDPRMKELARLESAKSKIDREADLAVRRELWAGLGYLIIQTAGFMRLTFWELSWDVMEPICYYVTSIYFMAAYTFFLRTSKEPSFEGFYQGRFEAKQRRLMANRNFDTDRYNELRRMLMFGVRSEASGGFDRIPWRSS